MRLITHNMLKSNVKGATTGFPLKIEAEKVETKETEFNADFIINMLPKLHWEALREGAAALGLPELPPESEIDDAKKEDEEFLRRVHHVLLDVHVIEGALVCPDTGRRFVIKDSVPNMLLHEDEI